MAVRVKSKPRRPSTGSRKATESAASRQERAQAILAGLKTLYADADCALLHRNALELLVATILSAQSTDANVNRVTPLLFARYPDARSLAEAEVAELEKIIHSTGFFRQKSRSILGAARRIVEVYGGNVPDTLAELVTLPGVARKTANVILGTWFGKNEGMVVDTHIGRLARRLGLTWSSRDEKDAGKIELDLMQVVPQAEWTFFGHALIWHGRKVCAARKPNCAACTLTANCPSAFRCNREAERAGRAGGKRRRGNKG